MNIDAETLLARLLRIRTEMQGPEHLMSPEAREIWNEAAGWNNAELRRLRERIAAIEDRISKIEQRVRQDDEETRP